MPGNLNQLLEEDSDRIICFEGQTDQPVSLSQFKARFSRLRQAVARSRADSWLLYADNSCNFAVGLLSLLSLNKQVIICANGKPGWITQFSDKFDAVLSDNGLCVAEKMAMDFSSIHQNDETKNDSWRPSFSGHEKLVFFTSGSSGKAKAIAKPLLALTNEVATLEQSFGEALCAGTNPEDNPHHKSAQDNVVFVASISHHHIYGLLFRILWPLLRKSSWLDRMLVFPEQLPAAAATFPKLMFASSPAFLSRLDLKLPAITTCQTFSSGGPLTFQAATTAGRLLGGLPTEVYGSTETGGIAFRQQHSEATPWTPFPGVLLSQSAAGVTIISPNMPGLEDYLLDDQLNIAEDGKFELRGRRDRIVKIEEKRVSLTEIERSLEDFDTIEQCVVVVLTGMAGLRTVLACAVVLSDRGRQVQASHDDKVLIRQWKLGLGKRFEPVTMPKKWRIVDEIPVTTQSKTDMAALLEYFHSVQPGQSNQSIQTIK